MPDKVLNFGINQQKEKKEWKEYKEFLNIYIYAKKSSGMWKN